MEARASIDPEVSSADGEEASAGVSVKATTGVDKEARAVVGEDEEACEWSPRTYWPGTALLLSAGLKPIICAPADTDTFGAINAEGALS